MKNLVLVLILLSGMGIVKAQNLYKTTSSDVNFFSATSMEDIKAKSKEALSIINTLNNEIAVVVGVRTFHFESALMEEHFNENYMESDKYKTAHFKGQVIGGVDYLKDGEYKVKAKGVLNIHGVDKEREISGIITIKNGTIELNSSFDVHLKDHKIKIPKMVIKNIAETIKVTVKSSLIPKTN